MRTATLILSLVLAAIFTAPIAPARAQDAKREITQIKGDLYRFKNNFHYSVFYVTPDGVIATDPIDASAAEWLKTEIKARFNQPIKYVIYSHDHRDHIAGGEVFAKDGATIVSHVRTKQVIGDESRPTAMPNITFKHKLDLELGGKTVELRYLGKNHSDNMIVMRFPAEGVLFAVDFIPVKTVAFKNFPDAYLPEWIRSLEKVERMDFDILAPGHGSLGTKADVTLFKDYMSDLYNQVMVAARAGKSLEETRKAVDMSKYKNLANFDTWGPMNIDGAYDRIQLNRRGN